MGIVQISKDGPKFNPKKNEGMDKVESLDSLNISSTDYEFDFGNNSAGMNKGKIKIERNLLNACLTTITNTMLKVSFLGIIVFIIFRFVKIDLGIFSEEMYNLSLFNGEVIKLACIILGTLLIVSFVFKFNVNSSVKGCFRRKYLNKKNIYIYDVFIIVFNILLYVILALLYFAIVNKFYVNVVELQKAGNIVREANLEIINLMKYGIVIIVGLFIGLNSWKCIDIVHLNNKFVFDEEI